MQSKHDVTRIIDDVSTLMTLMSLYHSSEKKLGLKFTKFYVFLEVFLEAQFVHIHGFLYDSQRFTPISHGQKNRGESW